MASELTAAGKWALPSPVLKQEEIVYPFVQRCLQMLYSVHNEISLEFIEGMASPQVEGDTLITFAGFWKIQHYKKVTNDISISTISKPIFTLLASGLQVGQPFLGVLRACIVAG